MDKAYLERVQKQRWVHLHPRAGPVFLFLLMMAITVLSVVAFERAESSRRETELQNRASEAASGVERVVTEHLAILHAAAAVFSLRDSVTEQEFTAFAEGLRNRGAFHGSIGIGWAQKVEPERIAEFEGQMRAGGEPGYKVFPLPAERKIAVPVVYLEPESGSNLSAIGFDLYSDPVRREAMDLAARSQEPVTSGKLVRTAPRGSAGFNIFMPVFGRRSEQLVLKGFVFSSFRANDFLASATPLYADPSLEVSLYDGAVMPDRLMAQGPMRGKVGSMVERKVTIGNRNWILTVGRTRSGTLSDLSRVGLLFGIVTSLLVLAVARLITRRAEEDRLVVEWLTRQSGIRNSLTRELNHRVKNTLANVLSIVSLTRRRATDLDDFADSLTGRLRALSATHDLLSQTDWREVSIHDLIRAELAPYLETLDNRITVRGPDISLAPNEALSFGLAIHELMTNAAKYGSLTNEAGTITIEWHLKSPDVAEVLWREEGGPEVQPPSRRGFGIELLEKIVARELDTNFDIQFLPGGVQCRLHLPVRKLSDFNLRTKYAS